MRDSDDLLLGHFTAACDSWDLARAISTDEHLDQFLVEWILGNLEWIYRDSADSPIAVTSGHRFFAAPTGTPPATGSAQDRLLHLMGRHWRNGSRR